MCGAHLCCQPRVGLFEQAPHPVVDDGGAADNTLDFVKMLSGRKSVNWFTDEANKREAALTKDFIDRGVEADKNDADVKRAGALLFESGFADNSSNVR